MSNTTELLEKLLAAVSRIQDDQKALAAAVDAINGRVNALADVKTIRDAARPKSPVAVSKPLQALPKDEQTSPSEASGPGSHVQKKPTTSRIILTTYPGQSGIDPIVMNWGENDPSKRGPVVVGRGSQTLGRRNGLFDPAFVYSFNMVVIGAVDLNILFI
jgi:hypothetical protein